LAAYLIVKLTKAFMVKVAAVRKVALKIPLFGMDVIHGCKQIPLGLSACSWDMGLIQNLASTSAAEVLIMLADG